MPRRTIHCSHCKESGHNISSCSLYKIDIDTKLVLGTEVRPYSHRSLRLSSINLQNIAHLKMVFDGSLNYTIQLNYLIKYDTETSKYIFEKKYGNELKELKKNNHVNTDIFVNTFNNFKTRIKYFLENTVYQSFIQINELIGILHHDHIEVTTRIHNDYLIREQRYREELQQQQLRREQREREENLIINREHLPILRTSEIESNDCPICLDPLGETNKTVLRCGHSLCTNCLITQTLRAAATKTTSNCGCPVCRTPYI